MTITTTPKDAVKDASMLLDLVWDSSDAEYAIPVDPVKIARALGIDVQLSALTGEISGALVRDNQGTTIYLNSDQAKNRQRFTCAHELGHYMRRLLHAPAGEGDFESIDYRDSRAAAGTSAEEIYANGFAAALLMPESAVKKMHKRGATVVSMALAFGVSTDAMSIRCGNLGLSRS